MSQAAATTSVMQLTKAHDFAKSGRCPISLNHLLFNHKESLQAYGAVFRYGRHWLVDEPRFFNWLREHGQNAGRVSEKTKD